MSDGISGLLHSMEPSCAEPQRKVRPEPQTVQPPPLQLSKRNGFSPPATKPWTSNLAIRIEQALRATDLLLQAGGFSAIVLDLGSIAPEHVSRIPLTTWFRYRAAAERSRASVLLLTQHACSKSSAGLVLHLQALPLQVEAPHLEALPLQAPQARSPLARESTVLAGLDRRIEVTRQRFTDAPAKVVPLRKPPQRATSADWRSKTAWAGSR